DEDRLGRDSRWQGGSRLQRPITVAAENPQRIASRVRHNDVRESIPVEISNRKRRWPLASMNVGDRARRAQAAPRLAEEHGESTYWGTCSHGHSVGKTITVEIGDGD